MTIAKPPLEWHHPYALRLACRSLWGEAAKRPSQGLTEDDTRELLPDLEEDARAEILELAKYKGYLIQVRRMEAESPDADHWRYFAMGARP